MSLFANLSSPLNAVLQRCKICETRAKIARLLARNFFVPILLSPAVAPQTSLSAASDKSCNAWTVQNLLHVGQLLFQSLNNLSECRIARPSKCLLPFRCMPRSSQKLAVPPWLQNLAVGRPHRHAHCKSPTNVPPISKVRKHTTCLTLNPSHTFVHATNHVFLEYCLLCHACIGWQVSSWTKWTQNLHFHMPYPEPKSLHRQSHSSNQIMFQYSKFQQHILGVRSFKDIVSVKPPFDFFTFVRSSTGNCLLMVIHSCSAVWYKHWQVASSVFNGNKNKTNAVVVWSMFKGGHSCSPQQFNLSWWWWWWCWWWCWW